ncbi:HIT family protein [Saccharopolyspora sp. TS4A08]|uniref:HIT family protein n=1 Tax=Saccharopolyspora ipomoeae TaxID=3042027 RepID=A0ABT6PHY9_9PSEU|nr:HIT family protein [Saccharopolyspora sp. TS4A08]MDI2027616.1 HIT family protein [Saccharopolyspora sp. TS4A08]
MSDACVFCGIVAGELPSVKVAEDETTLAFMDIHPASDGHLLVTPKRHSQDLFDIPADDLTAVTLAGQRIAKVAAEEFGADGVNLLNCCGSAAWQSVFHFHLHVIPRYRDKSHDTLTLPWKPHVPGDANLLTDLGNRLSNALN